jgi:transposase
MTQPLSQDLRFRIARAVCEKGLSRRQAAAKFDVAPSTAIIIVAEFEATGTLAVKKQGGDRRSGRIEAHAETILALVEATPDITLAEIGAHIERVTGERFGTSVIHRFFARRGITFKKNRARQRTGPI